MKNEVLPPLPSFDELPPVPQNSAPTATTIEGVIYDKLQDLVPYQVGGGSVVLILGVAVFLYRRVKARLR